MSDLKKFCTNCGNTMPEDSLFCPKCGIGTSSGKNSQTAQTVIINNTQYPNAKNKWIALLFCLFLGSLGAHKFYEGKFLLGFLYLITLGFLGIGVFIDAISLLFKPNPYFV